MVMELILWSIYKVKKGCPLEPFKTAYKSKYTLMYYAYPIDAFNKDKDKGDMELDLIIGLFDGKGIDPKYIYSMKLGQFEECFEYCGTFKDNYIPYYPYKTPISEFYKPEDDANPPKVPPIME
jgi:hypothetical protein